MFQKSFLLNVTHSCPVLQSNIILYCWFAILIFFFSSRDEFRKLKSEVDGPQFTEYELVKYRKKLDEEREAKLKGLSNNSSNKKKKKKHHNHHHHSYSRDRDHKRKRSKSEGSLNGNGNFGDHEDECYDEEYEKRKRRQIDEEDRNEHAVEKVCD